MKLVKLRSTSQDAADEADVDDRVIDIAGLGKRSQITDGGDRPGVHDRDEGGIVIGRDEHHEDDHDQKRPLLQGVFADLDPDAGVELIGQFFFFVLAAHKAPPSFGNETILVWILAMF
jgi:hypothetical protein